MKRLLVALAAVALLGGVAALVLPRATAIWRQWRAFQLPAALRIEEVPLDLSARFDRGAVTVEPSDDPVRTGPLQPGHVDDVDEENRPAIIAPPASRLHFRVAVPDGARLRFGIGVQSKLEIDPALTGVRFTVDVDGGRRFDRTLNPAGRHRDRRWFTEEVDLGPFAGREVDVVFSTERDDPRATPAGIPGWSHLRLVRATLRGSRLGRRCRTCSSCSSTRCAPTRLLRRPAEPDAGGRRAGATRARLRAGDRAGGVDVAVGREPVHGPLPAEPRRRG